MSLVPSIPGLQREMNRLFDGMLSRPSGFDSGETLSDWAPRVDVIEHDDSFTIRADLPGLKREDIHVNVEKNTLSISGERSRESEQSGDRWYRSERSYGSFKRVFSLPATVEPDKVGAEYKGGVLTVSLPKAAEARPRMVDVKIDD